MMYPVALIKSEEGYAVFCPTLPGCCSQGDAEEEALENIRDAIRDYLEVVMERVDKENLREVEVTV